MRMVRQLADALARIAGLKKAKLHDAALLEAEAAMGSLAAIDPKMVEAADTASLLAMIQEPRRLDVVGRLLLEAAEVEEARGATARAAGLREKGAALRAEAARRGSAGRGGGAAAP